MIFLLLFCFQLHVEVRKIQIDDCIVHPYIELL